MSLELKLMIVTAIFVADWIIVSFFKCASKKNKEYDKQMEELRNNEESVHSDKE